MADSYREINQLVELTKDFQGRLTKKKSYKYLWMELWAFMIYGHVCRFEIKAMLAHRYQIQYIE